jgi:hypothetical protein
VVLGTNAPGSCGFTLSDPAQALRFVTISTFPVGLRTTATTGRPTASLVTVESCDAGVYVAPGSQLLLQEPTLDQNGNGLVSDGGDVVVDGGTITRSIRNGVLMTGAGGTLSLTGASVNTNCQGIADDLAGAGVLIASSGGTATIGAITQNNGQTGVTIAGTSNQVTFDGADLRGGSISLVVKDPTARVLMRNTKFSFCPTAGLRLDAFATFNGGTGDGGYGNNNFGCNPGLEIWDTRTSIIQDLDFADTTLRGLHMDAGSVISGPTTGDPFGVKIQGANSIHFH